MIKPIANHQASAQLDAKQTQLQIAQTALQAKDAEIKRKDLKIDALTFELARLRRIQFGAKNETLSPLQRDLFAETLATDIAAIEGELEQLAEAEPCTTVAKPKRPRAGRQPLPEHLPRTCALWVLNTDMNPSPAVAASVVARWLKSVKTSLNN